MGGPSYTAIRGSDQLRTQKRGASKAAVVEGADRASVARVDVDVDGAVVSVGRVVVGGKSVPLLLDVVDRVFPLLEPEELAVFVHLYRLALENERDVCRVSRAELTRRTRLADRRLGRALAGLVDKAVVVLVDRDRDGTLYRLVFPDEAPQRKTALPQPALPPPKTTTALPEPAPPPKTTTALPQPAPAKKKQKQTTTPTTTPTTTAVPHQTAPHEPPPTPDVDKPLRSVGDACAHFAAKFGNGPGRSGGDVASVVLELLEEGVTFAQMPGLFEAFVKAAPKTTPLRDWASFVRR